MSGQTFINDSSTYYAPYTIQDEISQLQETSAVAPNVQTANAIATWNTGLTGPTSDHNLLNNTSVLLDQSSNITGCRSLQFNTSSGPTGLYQSGGNLFFNSTNLSVGVTAGGVAGPVSSTDSAIALFNGTNGMVIKNSNITIGPTGGIYMDGNKYITRPATSSQTMGLYAGNSLGVTGIANSVFGEHSMETLVNGTNNCAYGAYALQSLAVGGSNTAIGASSLVNTSTSSGSIAIGSAAGSLATGPLTSAIYVGSQGNPADVSAIRIGNLTQDSCYMSGIYGYSATGTTGSLYVVIDSTGRMRTSPQYYTFRNDNFFGSASGTGAQYFKAPLNNAGATLTLSATGTTGGDFPGPSSFDLNVVGLRGWFIPRTSGSTGTVQIQITKNGTPITGTAITFPYTGLFTIQQAYATQSDIFSIGDIVWMNVNSNLSTNNSQFTLGWEVICTYR